MTTQTQTETRATPAASHTPGPWSINRDEYRIYVSSDDRSRGDVAVMLLAALMFAKDKLLELKRGHEGAWHEDEISEVDSAIKNARAAITKAEGRAL